MPFHPNIASNVLWQLLWIDQSKTSKSSACGFDVLLLYNTIKPQSVIKKPLYHDFWDERVWDIMLSSEQWNCKQLCLMLRLCVSLGLCGGRPLLFSEWRGKAPLKQSLTPSHRSYWCTPTIYIDSFMIRVKCRMS